MAGTDEIKAAVRDYVLREFLPDVEARELEDTTPLISGGILDSIATLKLVSFLEERYKVEFAAHELSADHLDTLDAIAGLVGAKLQGGA